VTGLVLASDLIPGETFQEVSNFLRRGESMEELRTLTGRTRAWEKAWPEILDSPVVGWGFQADRLLIREHVHNTHLYALMTAGFMGGLAFVGGLLWVWLLFFRVIKSGIAGRFNQETLLIQSGGILAFFTIRGIAEVSGPLFNIDFLVMLPIMAYLSLLDRHRRSWLEQQREERRRSGVRT
jgi:O-antigen ligase